MRFVDRVEACAAVTAAALLVVAALFAVQVSDAVRADQAEAADVEAAQRHPVDAIALERAKATPQRTVTKFTVRVQWFANGTTREKVVDAQGPVKAGDRVGIWVDARGDAVSPPRGDADIRSAGVGAGFGVWGLCALVVAGALAALRRSLNRVRARGWDRDLVLLVGNGGGSTANNP
ncbi:hypothetical protein AU194_28415 [Mycobacterium sp. GA-2829]|nr:hypothetical protein AU194_28415 [Mycobacterium sp. GA-2829]